ncbi:MAG: RNA polymerase sigma factor [Planctomycetes bacterium]|nr:RNA polymerase sigma factor [Planctomycetota bacterium]
MTDSREIPELLEAFRKGDREAFRTIFERHEAMVYSVAAHLTGDRELARDVAQEVFVRLFAERDRIREPRALSTWLYRVAVREAIDASRREGLRRGLPLEDPAVRQTASSGTSPGEAAAELETRERVRRALLSLSPRLRAVAVLRYLEGLSYEEIGEALGLGAGTVKSRLFRAHEALAEILEDER